MLFGASNPFFYLLSTGADITEEEDGKHGYLQRPSDGTPHYLPPRLLTTFTNHTFLFPPSISSCRYLVYFPVHLCHCLSACPSSALLLSLRERGMSSSLDSSYKTFYIAHYYYWSRSLSRAVSPASAWQDARMTTQYGWSVGR